MGDVILGGDSVPESQRSTGGVGVTEDRVLGEGEPALVVNANIGIGAITVERN